MKKINKKIALVLVLILTLSFAMQKYDDNTYAAAPSMSTSTTSTSNVENEDMAWDPNYPESEYDRTYVLPEYGYKDVDVPVEKKISVPAKYETKTVITKKAWTEKRETTVEVVDYIPESTEEYEEWVEATTDRRKELVPEHTETYQVYIPETTVRDKDWIPESTETYTVRIPSKTVSRKRWIPESTETYTVRIPSKTVRRKTWTPERTESYQHWISSQTVNKKSWISSRRETYRVWVSSKRERRKSMTPDGWRYYYVTVPGHYETKTRYIPGRWNHYTETIPGRYETRTRTIPGKWSYYNETIPGRDETRTRTIPGEWDYYTETIPASYDTRTRTVGGDFRYYDRVVPGHNVTRTRTVPDTWRYYDVEVPGHFVTKTRIVPAHKETHEVKKIEEVHHPAETEIQEILLNEGYEKTVIVMETISNRVVVKEGYYEYNRKKVEEEATNEENSNVGSSTGIYIGGLDYSKPVYVNPVYGTKTNDPNSGWPEMEVFRSDVDGNQAVRFILLNVVAGDLYDLELIIIGYDFEENRWASTGERLVYLAFAAIPGSAKVLKEISEEVAEKIIKEVGEELFEKAAKETGEEVLEKGIKEGTVNLVDDFDSVVDDIISINKKYADGMDINNPITSIVNSASYYDDPYEQVGAIGRGIAQHAFENGNKRTAFDTMRKLMSDMNLSSPLSDDQLWDLVYDMNSRDGLSDVAEIAKRLQGK